MKLKTNKSVKKRFKIKNNLFYRKKANTSHLLRKKSSNRLRRLSVKLLIDNSDKKRFINLISHK